MKVFEGVKRDNTIIVGICGNTARVGSIDLIDCVSGAKIFSFIVS